MPLTITLRELRTREVIRVCDGKSLGCVTDIRFDSCSGHICALVVVTDGGKLFSFSGAGELYIPWDAIRCIGDDAILADLPPGACVGQKRWGK